MHPGDSEAFKKQLSTLAVVFGKELPDELVGAYWNALRDVSLSAVQACATIHMRRGKFFPKPAELRPKDPVPDAVLVRDTHQDNFAGDRWDVAGNRLLLSHVRTRLADRPRVWGAPLSPEQAAATEILVKHKRAWSQGMRDWDGIPSAETQRAAWDNCMERAEAEIHPSQLKDLGP